ncbi:MAG: hypothetical protein RL748_1729 [Pseudomonadota bacterium]|jgi:adenylate cyclase
MPARQPVNSPLAAPAADQRTARRFGFQRFQTRLLAVMLLLILGLQVLVFATISSAANRNARQASEEALQLTARSMQSIMATRETSLRKYARLLASDYAFKDLVSEGHGETVLSAFQSYQRRLGADSMVLLDLQGKVLADTLAQQQPDYGALLQAARANEQQNGIAESSGVVLVGQQAYQMVLVPLNAPQQVAWVGIGFALTDAVAQELEQQTHTQVTLVWHTDKVRFGRKVLASTLPAEQRQPFPLKALLGATSSYPMQLLEHEYLTLTLPLNRTGDYVLSAVLQRSMDEALAGFRTLRWQLLAVFGFSTLLATLAGSVIARRVTRPLHKLAQAAEQIRAGHYTLLQQSPQSQGQGDEFTALGQTFNNMVRGLQERDQVRSLLGKVVSPAVAQELLSRQIELGGEEREVSLLFSDIRDFTTLVERRQPAEVLRMLNTYFSRMSEIIDSQQGVVDKYIGDAIMALYGAPVSAPDDPDRALTSALAMVTAMPELNRIFTAQGWPVLSIGIGIHSGVVVAGNVGSSTRLNYTVLGDSVNLAARLESLCKKYQVSVVVSEACVMRCPQFAFRELDRVRVKGKRQAVSIYQLVGRADELGTAQQALLRQHDAALRAYRHAEFDSALAQFLALPQDAVSEMYRGRCARFLKHPPDPDWDAIETLDEK